jgi:carbon monoxide dehydrogenase subunit G
MIITETFSLRAPRARVSALLLDVESVSSCVPGVTGVARISPTEYEATLEAQVGPVKSAFRGSVSIDDSDAPDRWKATARGTDRASGSIATVTFDARLIEAGPDLTTVDTTADVSIRGRLGRFGTGVIEATAKQMIDEFVSCVDARLSATREGDTQPPAGRPVPLLRTMLLALWARLRSLTRRDRARGEKTTR